MTGREVPLTKGYVAIVDEEDFARVNAFKWTASIESRGTKVYAIRWVTRNGKREKIRMSHFVLDVPPGTLRPGMVVDHIEEKGFISGLDNRKANLRIITQAENMAKSPGWKKRPVEPYL